MENCVEHQLRIDLFPLGGQGEKHFWVVKCQKCHQIFSVFPTNNLDGILQSLLGDFMNITTQLAKIESHLETIAKKI